MAYVVAGRHAVLKVLERFPRHVERVLLAQDMDNMRFEKVLQLAKAHKVVCERVPAAVLAQKAQDVRTQGLVAFCTQLPTMGLENVFAQLENVKHAYPTVVVLDKIQDPHNLGAILRSAAAFSVDAVIVSKHQAAHLTPTAIRVSCGGALVVPLVTVVNLSRAISKLKQAGFWIYATSEHARTSLTTADYQRPVAWVMGNEANGVSKGLMKACDETFYIDVSLDFSTLNVSVSTGVCLYETMRNRGMVANQ